MHHLPGLGGWCIFIRVMFYLKYMIMYLFVFFISFISNIIAQQEGDSVGFRVASYNIRYAAEEDEVSGNGWELRKKPLAQLVLTHQFDIIGTQEGNKQQLQELKDLLPGYSYVGYPYGGNGDLHNCATFYKDSLFEVLDEGVFWYSETPDVPSIGWDATDRRVCNWVEFREKQSGIVFYFFNSHFYWRYNIAREKSGAVLVNKIKKIVMDAPVISVGDYNSVDSTRQIATILQILNDARLTTEVEPKGPLGTSFPGGVFKGEPSNRIDYIFHSSHFRVCDYMVFDDTYADGRYPSDHLPVSSWVVIKRYKNE